ncbi:MAG: helicase-exonuclease AddAB subunit AddA, partial [Oscillospiraceae bacterium]|nr:helicase-exonuclease AddAB subunit AddA [Oscillospiraceae bacterium]
KTRAKNLWDSAKKSLADSCAMFDASAEEMTEDLRTMAPAMLSLLALTTRFSEAYQQEKRRRNAADFSDQEHEAIALLRDEDGAPTELARSVAGRYREIMVDEYQDTNEVQNCIFEAISRGGKNLFTVGDVKQSIYRFRLADPTIFLDHYERYPHVSAAREGESAKLLLSRNFRSRAEVLEGTNYVFENLLSREMGELDYGEDEMLRVGADYPEKADARTEFHVVDLAAHDEAEEEKLRAADAEADFVAGYIKDLLTSKFTVQDDKTKELRAIREEDIVILMRSPSARLATFRRALEERGIACAAEGSGAFYETMEISVIFALLRLIDNPRQDVPLISVLRSPLFAFSPNRLAAIRANLPRGEFYDALAADTGEDTTAFLTLLTELRNFAQEMSIYELLQLVYERCTVRAIFGAMPRGRERRENLEAFLALAADLDGAGFRHLFDFVMHLQDLLASDQAPVPQISRAESGVRIMTIHKSKGLEFPVVILCDLAKPFNDLDFRTSVLVHPKSGLGPLCVDRERMIQYPTAAREAIERELRREAKSEELRILYVAMTRAKEKLVMVYTHRNAEKQLARLHALTSRPVLSETVAEQKCLGDWLLLALLTRPEARVLRELAGAEEENLYAGEDIPWGVYLHEAFAARKSFLRGSEASAEEVREEPDMKALAFRYPHVRAADLPAKLTATQLKGRAIDAEISENAALPPRLRSLKRPQFLSGTKALSGAERGTAIHALLEHLPFATKEEQVESVIDDLLCRRLLSAEQAEAIDRSVIVRFLRSPICARLRAAKQVEREYHFSLLRPVNEVLAGVEETDEVLLQGVVDCFFEEDGALVVVDFKTDRITREQLHERAEQYRPQLEAYAAALERVMERPVREKILCFLHLGEEVAL